MKEGHREETHREETGDKEAGGEFSEVMCPQSSSPLPSPLYKCEQVHHPCWLSGVIADSRGQLLIVLPTYDCGKAEWRRCAEGLLVVVSSARHVKAKCTITLIILLGFWVLLAIVASKSAPHKKGYPVLLGGDCGL